MPYIHRTLHYYKKENMLLVLTELNPDSQDGEVQDESHRHWFYTTDIISD